MAGSTSFECWLRYSSFFFLFSGMQYIFLFRKDVLCGTRVVQLFLQLRLKYYDAKIQMLSVFSWKPGQPRYAKIKRLHFLRTLKRWPVLVLLLPCCVSRCFPMAEWRRCWKCRAVYPAYVASHKSHWNKYTSHWMLTIGDLFSLTLWVCDIFLLVKRGFTLTSILAPRE